MNLLTVRYLTSFLIAGILTLSLVPADRLLAAPNAKKMMKRMDADGDRKISRDEWLGRPPMFDKFDTNEDGYLTKKEISDVLEGKDPKIPDSERVKWVDVHVHTNGKAQTPEWDSVVRDAKKTIDRSNMKRAILMPTPQNGENRVWKMEDFAYEASKSPGKFALMGGGGSLNIMIHRDSPDGIVSPALKTKFRQRAEEILSKGAIGFGEMSILHFSLVPGHSFESVAGDHPLFLLLADIAAEHDVPIDMHFDPVPEEMPTPEWLRQPPNPKTLKENLSGFERLLDHNPKAKIVWAHAGSDNTGTWDANLTRRMLEKHPNLYMSIRMTVARAGRKHYPLNPLNEVKPIWLQLFQDFPDRFVIGGDQFFVPTGNTGPLAVFAKHAEHHRTDVDNLLAGLPRDLAQKIGYENVERIYKLK